MLTDLSIKVARIYMRVSTDKQDLARQKSLVKEAQAAGYYIAGVYEEVASGARADRPELERLIADLQPGDVVIAEKLDRLTRLPLKEAERLIKRIQEKGARLSIPGVLDLSQVTFDGHEVTKRVIEAVQEIVLIFALQACRDDYEDRRRRQLEGIALAKQAKRYSGRKPNLGKHVKIVELRSRNFSIDRTAEMAGVSATTVKKVWKEWKVKQEKKAQERALKTTQEE